MKSRVSYLGIIDSVDAFNVLFTIASSPSKIENFSFEIKQLLDAEKKLLKVESILVSFHPGMIINK